MLLIGFVILNLHIIVVALSKIFHINKFLLKLLSFDHYLNKSYFPQFDWFSAKVCSVKYSSVFHHEDSKQKHMVKFLQHGGVEYDNKSGDLGLDLLLKKSCGTIHVYVYLQ